MDWPLRKQLNRMEQKLDALLHAQHIEFFMEAHMADQLADVRDNLQELGVDVDAAVNAIQQQRQEIQDALAQAGVDETARAEIMAKIDDYQVRIQNALNPQVPVDPNTPPADLEVNPLS